MQRKHFLQLMAGNLMLGLTGLYKLGETLPTLGFTMPVLFVGHGSPMNAIEENEFTKGWRDIAAKIPRPTAILCVSAHWETKGTQVTYMEHPKTIHDFGGFPQALFDVEYNAPGSKWLAEETKATLGDIQVGLDESWGLDHGAWSVLKHLYPNADVPVVQLSLDFTKSAQQHFELAQLLASLRKKGVLIVGSGNMVHNFQYMRVPNGNFNTHFGHDWAIEANEEFKQMILENNTQPLINYQGHSKAFQLAAPSPDHYLPMLYTLALRDKKDEVTLFNDAVLAGSFSMTSFMLGAG